MSTPIATPSTRRRARESGIDISALALELGRDTISMSDVQDVVEGRRTAATNHSRYWQVDHAQYGPVREEAVSRFSQVAAANLTAAHQAIPAVTHHDRADMTAIEAIRAKHRDEAQIRGVRLTGLVFHIKALCCALEDFPRFNASLSADGETLILKQYFHIGVAVDTPNGLMVPVIRDANRKGMWRIAAEVADLAARAQQRKVRPGEMGGASMSISNVGSVGGIGFMPVINPPELAILGVSRTEVTPVWDGQAFQPRPMTPLDLSYDHRVINGAEAARFLLRYAALLADPRRMLI